MSAEGKLAAEPGAAGKPKTAGKGKGKGKGERKGRGKKRQARGLTAFTENASVPGWVTAARVVLVLAYAAAVPFILGVEEGRRLFWAAAIAVLPVFWVVGGYHLWRRICPLAVFSQVGRYVGAPGQRRVGGWLADNYMLVQLGLMLVALTLRLVMTNGTEWALVGFVGVATVAAAVVGFVYTGKTWCNFLCPVGMVEKMYTEPSRLGGTRNSQCAPCTACKKNCPDIDLEQGYWKESEGAGRRVAYFAWPGIVVAFYAYYYLVAGDWDYYFSGAWTLESDQIERWASPGLFFFEAVPVVVAAPLTLLVCGAVSYAVFAFGERVALRVAVESGAGDVVRHRALVLAGFVGFVLFYFFGGQPTIRRAPGWVGEGFAAAVVIAGAALFLRRWNRREQDFVHEKFATKILKKWEWGEAPPSERLQDIYLLHTERTKQREARLGAYKETIREMVGDGVVTGGELAILDSLRAQLGVSEKDHERILDELSAEERQLFDPAYRGSVEVALQREQYRMDLENAIVAAARSGADPSADALDDIRRSHAVSEDEHRALVAVLLDRDGPVVTAYKSEVAEIESLAAACAAARAAPDAGSTSFELLAHVCRWRGRQRADHALRLLAPLTRQPLSEQVREHLVSRVDAARDEAAEELATAVGADLASPLTDAVRRLLSEDPPDGPAPSLGVALGAIADDASTYVRATVAHVLSRLDDDDARALVERATEDESDLVRESAYHALAVRGRLRRELMSRALKDPVSRVRDAAVYAVAGRSSASDDTALGAADLAETKQAVATLDSRQRLDTLSTLQRMMFLRQVPMFAEVDPDDLAEVSRIAEERAFVIGADLCREGERGDDVFLIVAGRVTVWTGTVADKRVLGESGVGDCIGEMAVFDDAPRSATVTAAEPTRTLVLPGDDFKTLMLARPAIGQSIIGVLVERMRNLIAKR